MKRLAAVAVLLLLPGLAPQAARPNVVLILADDLGWRDLGCTGSTFYETPAIDRLSARSLRFTQAYSACNVCSPTRSAIQTGKNPARLHTTNFFGGNRKGALLPPAYRQSLPLEDVTLAEAFRAAGYRTAIAGKWHLGGKGSMPSDHGYDVVLGAETKPAGGPIDDPHFATMLSTKAAEFVAKSKEEPFFLYLPLHSPHVGLKTRPALAEKYRQKAAALGLEGVANPVDAGPGFHARSVQSHAVYAGMIQEMDEAVDRVLTSLDEAKVADRTIVVFTSDNGGLSTSEGSPTANVPLRAGKGWNYEGGLRIPLLVRVPGRVASGSTCATPVVSQDLYPTLLELAGVPVPAGQALDAVGFVPLLDGKEALPDRDLFWHYPHYSNQGGRPSGAIRSGALKLHEFYEDGRVELYDLVEDPAEQRNLATLQADRATQLLERLRAWRASVAAQMPSPNPVPVEPFPRRP